jgi:hypothetical protein
MGKVIGKTYPKKKRGGNVQTSPAQTPPANGTKQNEGEK